MTTRKSDLQIKSWTLAEPQPGNEEAAASEPPDGRQLAPGKATLIGGTVEPPALLELRAPGRRTRTP